MTDYDRHEYMKTVQALLRATRALEQERLRGDVWTRKGKLTPAIRRKIKTVIKHASDLQAMEVL